MLSASAAATTRGELIDWYRRNRARSRALFDLIDPDVYFTRPIALRNPIAFYEGHLPAFSVISLLKRGLGRGGVDDRLEVLFARGIDPESEQAAAPRSGPHTRWPSRAAILEYGEAADALILAALANDDFDLEGRSHHAMRSGEAIFTALEHEAMHQETLLYMWRRLPYSAKRKPRDITYEIAGASCSRAVAAIPEGRATLGASRPAAGELGPFGWDNEHDEHQVAVGAFDIDVHSVTNAQFLEFMQDGGYDREELWDATGWAWRQREHVQAPAFWASEEGTPFAPQTRIAQWRWRGMFEPLDLPPHWPAYVSQAEAAAFARWRGRRLPTEPEYHRAAYGTPAGGERLQPWGDAPPDARHGNFDFASWEPVPAGSRPAGASAWGVHDLIGNGWEWTSTVFAPFPGFAAMPSYPEYSAEFFDGEHVVLKGASPATARELVRRSFRNWFRPTYPFVCAKFRTAQNV